MADDVINILLVEDDSLACRFVKLLLSDSSEAEKFDIETVGNLSGAIEFLNNKTFDIILLDLQLPDSSGTNTVKRIHASNPDVPIVVLTALDGEEMGVQAIKSGADDYLAKGEIFKDVLVRSIHYAIERKKRHKLVEKTLKDERRKLQNHFDVAEVILVVIDTDQKVGLINRKGCETLGYSENEIIGKNWCDNLVPESARNKAKSVISRALKGQIESAEYFENPILTKSGAERIVVWHNSILHDEKDQIEAVLIFGEDITERRQAEHESKTLNADLEATVGKLALLNRDLKDFAHIATHDLKAPLQAISTLANWISVDHADEFDESDREKVKQLVERAERMSKLIDGVLQYSEDGDTEHEKQEVDLNTLLSELIVEIAPPENIEITVENKLPTVICEKAHIRQIFQGLLSNAVKYMDKPKGQIKVGGAEEKDFWKFSVADNGSGIEEKHFEKIFEILQTPSTPEEVEATGIALPVVKKIVETYGGRVWLESELGKGSTFLFTFPRSRDAVETEKQLLKPYH